MEELVLSIPKYDSIKQKAGSKKNKIKNKKQKKLKTKKNKKIMK